MSKYTASKKPTKFRSWDEAHFTMKSLQHSCDNANPAIAWRFALCQMGPQTIFIMVQHPGNEATFDAVNVEALRAEIKRQREEV